MEQTILSTILCKWKDERGVRLDETQESKLIDYVRLIHETNNKFNITGFKTIEEILINLIIGSLNPLASINVPRGTVFADIGTGAGIPGIPLAIFNDNWTGICIDSNNKKVSFVDSVIRECGIDNLRVHNGRLEDLAREEMRERFNFVFSRALGEIFFVVEVGAPMLKIGGLLYVYYNTAPEDLPRAVIQHIRDVGLILLERERYSEYGIKETGIVLIKKRATGGKYPRTMTAIKRDIQNKIRIS